MELLVIALLLTATGAQGSQLEGPQNTLSVVGSNVILKCVSPSKNCQLIEWQKLNSPRPMSVFTDRVGILHSFTDRYSVENSSGCHLVIKNVDPTDAGCFICKTFISSDIVEKSAYLIILKNQSKCMTNASQDKTEEGDGVHLTCEVTYNGTSTASMVWKDVDDAPDAVVKNKTISRSYAIVASAPEVPSFTCFTSFAVEEYIGGLAKNIPVTTCRTPAIKVLYSVRNVTLSPSRSYYSSGTAITCAAKGHPSPTFKWQETEINGVWMNIQNQNGNQFTMTNVSSKRYRCVSMNVVRGESYNATSQEFMVQEFKDTLSSTPPCASVDRLGIGVGIGLLVAILLATVAFVILVKLRYLGFHPRPANESNDGGTQCRPMDHEMHLSNRQLSAMHQPIPRTEVPLVGEQESAYASLGEERDANEYAALELRQKAKPKKKFTA